MKKEFLRLGLTPLLMLLALAACTVTPIETNPTPTLETISVEAASAAYPQITRQNPLPGERLGLSPVIEISFDRNMEPAQTASAWSFLDEQGQPIAGKIDWVDAQTLKFTPQQPLAAGATYTGVLSTAAVSAEGAHLPEEIRLKYQTSYELLVGQVFPSNDASQVDRTSAITVIFNKPVIPLMTKEAQASLPAPIKISPPVTGQGDWVSPSVYVFQPETMLKSSTRYQVTVAAGLQEPGGTALAGDYSWSFTTSSPVVTGFEMKNVSREWSEEISDVLLDQAFVITFSQPMAAESLPAALSLTNVESKAKFPVTLSWDKSGTILTVTPVGKYAIASFYSLTIATSAQAQDGGTLMEPYQVKLNTIPLPAVLNTEPQGGRQDYFSPSLSVFFASPMNFESLKTRIRVQPEPATPLELYYDEYQKRLDIRGLEPSTEYVIRLQPGSADLYGNLIAREVSFRLETASLSPQARMELPYYSPLIYRAQGEKNLFFQYTNLASARIALYPLTFEEFTALQSGQIPFEDLDVSAKTPVSIIQPDLKAAQDRYARIVLNLDEPAPLAPGFYYAGLTAAPIETSTRFLQGAIFLVSGQSLMLKAGQADALAWLVDTESGLPVAGVPLTFYDSNWSVVGQASTDRDGLASVKDASGVQFVRSTDSRQVAAAALNWGAGVSEGQYGIWSDYWMPVKSTFAYVYSERALYRPGQPVYLKGIVRENDDLHYSLPAARQVYLDIENDQGRVFGGSVALSKEGTFASEYALSADAPVGNYYVYVRESAQSDNFLGSGYFRVAEYVKPQFAVSASAMPDEILNGETVKFGLQAAYYSGGNLANATVNWFLEAQPHYYQPPEAYNNFSFNDFDDSIYFGDGSATSGPPIRQEGQGLTDAQGHFEVEQVLKLAQEGQSEQVSFSANVSDVGGNLVGTSAQVTVLGSSLHAGIRPENYLASQGQPASFQLVVLNREGAPVAGQSVSVAFAEQRWYSVIREDENGLERWETSVKSLPAGQASAVSDENGLATVTFTPPNGGQFKATVSTQDEAGRPARASTQIWVSSESYIPWKQTNDRSFELVSDQKSYHPGETAKILIAQPFEGEMKALVTLERGHIYEKKVITLQNNSTVYELPISGDMAPAMYVSVMVIKGADGSRPPDFKLGMLRINVDPSQQGILVNVESDRETARPGESVTYTVTTRDLNGQPVAADVSLALVDQAVLALAPVSSQPLIEAFYPLRGLGVMTASSIVLNAEEFNANFKATDPSGEQAGSGGGKGEGDAGIVTVRQDFKDTAFWQAQVLTGPTGSAQVQVTLPDNLTTWQMKARAVTTDTRVGEATSDLLSTLPLQIQLQTPRFFVSGDAARLGAVIHNNTEKALEVTVSLQAEGVTLRQAEQQTLRVEAGAQGYVSWEANVKPGVERVDLTASASGGGLSDSTRPTLGTLPGQGIPVLSYHVTETVGSSGLLRDAGSITETIQLASPPARQNATLNLEVSPSLAASMTDGLTYLEDFPYLCMEQTVSRFLPNLVSLEALKLAGKSTSDLQKNLDLQVKPALQRLIGNQNYDGGWGQWPGTESQPTTSAYVMLGLVEVRQAGYSIPDEVLEYGLNYLGSSLPQTGATTENWQLNQAAFQLYALARGGQPNPGANSDLFENRANLDLYGKGLLMQAMHLADPQDARLTDLLSEIDSAATQSAAGAWWSEKSTDYWNWNTDTRSTAILLNALMQVDPQNPLLPAGVRWLMKHRQGAHWYSTQETAWSLMALTHWLTLSQEFETDYTYAIGLNGTRLATQHASAAHLTESTRLQLSAEELLPQALNALVFARGAGPGTLYYTAYLDSILPVKDITALDQGILISRQYFHPADLKTPITQAARGDLIQVRLTLVVPDSLHYVVIDDPLPAGMEAIDASLQTSQQVPMVYQAGDYDRLGWGWWYFPYKQINDEKVVFSADYLPAGTYTLTYLARASLAGEFNVLPSSASEFYFPEVAGRSAGSLFTITP